MAIYSYTWLGLWVDIDWPSQKIGPAKVFFPLAGPLIGPAIIGPVNFFLIWLSHSFAGPKMAAAGLAKLTFPQHQK